MDIDEEVRRLGGRFPKNASVSTEEGHIHNLARHLGGVIGARVYNSGNISVANAAWQTLTFDSERFDTDTIHSTSSNTGRLTCVTAGKYIISFNGGWDGSNSTGVQRAFRLLLNGATVIGSVSDAPRSSGNSIEVTSIYDLAATDYVEAQAYQDATGAASVNVLATANESPEFSMMRIGAAGSTSGGGSGTDHGGLTGLSDDDHALYLLAGGSRAGSTGTAQSFGATGIKADVVAESTAATGVTVDGLLIKDGAHGQITGTDDLHTEYVKEADANWIDLTDTGTTTLHSHTAVTAHNLLDGSTHPDTAAAPTPARGSLPYGSSSLLWDELLLGQTGQFTRSDGTDIDWDGIRQNDVRGQGGPYLGHTRTESTMVQCGANQVNVFGPYKILADMTVASGWAQLRITAGSGTCRMVIYQDNGSGVPSTLIDTSDEATITDTGATGSWKEFPFTTTPPSLAAQTSYWVGIISNSSNIQMGMTSATASLRLVGDVGHRLDTAVTYPTPDDPFTDNSNTVRVGACYVEGIPTSAGGAPPTGAAGGELAGTYPNPTVAATHSGSSHSALPVQTADLDMDGNDIIDVKSIDLGTGVIGDVIIKATSGVMYLRTYDDSAAAGFSASAGVFSGNITMGAGATVDGVDVGAHDVATTGVHGAGANTLLHSASAAGGDATGTLGALVITDDSHGHTSTTVTTHSTAHANDHAQAHTFDSHSDVPAITEAQGQVIYWNGSNWVALAPGTSGQFLKTQGAGANPIWATAAGGSALTVQEEDGTPIDTAVTIIRVPNGSLIDNGAGDVSIVFSGTAGAAGQPGAPGEQGEEGEVWPNVAQPYPKRQIVLRLDDTQVGASTGYKEEFLYPQSVLPPDITIAGDYATRDLITDTTRQVLFTWYIPADFVSFTAIDMIMIPLAANTLQVDLSRSLTAAGETAASADVVTALNQTKVIAAGDVGDVVAWDLKALSLSWGNAVAGDTLGIRVTRDTNTPAIVGLHIKYDSGTGSTTKAAQAWRNSLPGTFRAIADAEAAVGVTQTFTVYKNGVSAGTVTVTAGGRIGTLSSWSVALAWGDLVQVDHTSGDNSGTRHLVTLVEV